MNASSERLAGCLTRRTQEWHSREYQCQRGQWWGKLLRWGGMIDSRGRSRAGEGAEWSGCWRRACLDQLPSPPSSLFIRSYPAISTDPVTHTQGISFNFLPCFLLWSPGPSCTACLLWLSDSTGLSDGRWMFWVPNSESSANQSNLWFFYTIHLRY